MPSIGVGVARGSMARAKVTVTKPDGRVIETDWSEWELMTTNWNRICQGIFSVESPASSVTRSITAIDGVSGNAQIRPTTATFSADATKSYARVGWGSGSGTPARSDFEISGLVAAFNVSTQNLDESNGKFQVVGAAVYTGANTNITRLGLYFYFDIAGQEKYVLADHATFTSTPVATNDTVAITYEVQT